MDEEKRVCRRCLLYESGEIDVLADIRERIRRIPEKDRTPPGEYEQRLSFCRQCDDLIGGVCMKCGCYPEFRAAFQKNRCPHAAKKAW